MGRMGYNLIKSWLLIVKIWANSLPFFLYKEMTEDKDPAVGTVGLLQGHPGPAAHT